MKAVWNYFYGITLISATLDFCNIIQMRYLKLTLVSIISALCAMRYEDSSMSSKKEGFWMKKNSCHQWMPNKSLYNTQFSLLWLITLMFNCLP